MSENRLKNDTFAEERFNFLQSSIDLGEFRMDISDKRINMLYVVCRATLNSMVRHPLDIRFEDVLKIASDLGLDLRDYLR